MSQPKVTVVYCAEDAQYFIEVPFYTGMTAHDALEKSGLSQQVVLPTPLQLGVFGLKITQPETYLLQEGERVEVYRPLIMNPKDVRRLRAARHPVGRMVKGNQWRKQQDKSS